MESKEVEGRRAKINISAVFQFSTILFCIPIYFFFQILWFISLWKDKRKRKKSKFYSEISHLDLIYLLTLTYTHIYTHSYNTHKYTDTWVNDLNVYVWVCMCVSYIIYVYMHACIHTTHTIMNMCAKACIYMTYWEVCKILNE